MDKERAALFLQKNFFKLVCALCGLVTAILLLTLGFWRTLLLLLLVGAGALIGAVLDRGQHVTDVLNRILPGGGADNEK